MRNIGISTLTVTKSPTGLCRAGVVLEGKLYIQCGNLPIIDNEHKLNATGTKEGGGGICVCSTASKGLSPGLLCRPTYCTTWWVTKAGFTVYLLYYLVAD